ncbi:hypothetical protein P280DRAFT_441828 [Massarina eburnea CBS 473.64]|uniref:DUF6604 domain-containing protein n=1 Tax=Massarina eburnea CBS 473.64 TaxID=1395130 RepID=A0A6A6SCV2_9PLEO|nr:hypothetical protein P280DRAFT_441828 [Massarina eburnea CBS 473.64]
MLDLNEAQTFVAKYNRYKKATEYIGGWIAETAAFIGFEVKERRQKTAQPKAKRGKSKKANKNANAGASSGGGGSNKTTYQLKVADFVPMAKAIADARADLGSEVLVPIALTKRDGDEKSDLRHEYFIGILENTFQTLRPFIHGPEAARANTTQEASESGLTSKNRFAELTVEETVAIADSEDVDEESLPEVPNVMFEQDEEDEEEEFWCAVSLLLQEQEDMRDVVRDSWEEYKNGNIDLIVAAMVTDTAIKLAQKAEAQLDLTVSRPTKYPASQFPVWTLPAVLFYNNHETMHTWPVADIAKPSNTLGATTDAQFATNFDFWPVYAGLKFYLNKHITKKTLPQVVPKDFRDIDVHDRTLRAIEFAQMIRLIMEAPEQPEIWDPVSQGLQAMFKTHELPLWLTFGVQVHFDSQDILGEQLTRRTNFELQVYLNPMMARVQDTLEKWEDPFLPQEIEYEVYTPLIDAYNALSSWGSEDKLGKQLGHLATNPKFGGHPVLKKMRSEERYFYRQHPLLNGMMKYHFFLHYHAAGIAHEANSASLLMMAHVYVGGRLRYPDGPVWPDMEFVLFAQDPRYVLFKYPETPEEARDAFDLATGQRTVKQIGSLPLDRLDLSSNVLGLKYDPNSKSRLFRDASVFGDVYLPRGASPHWVRRFPGGGATNGGIDLIVQQLLNASLSPNSTQGRLARAMKTSQESQGVKLDPIAGLTSVAILQHFAVWLQADMVDFCFDWILMQRHCSDAWKVIYQLLEKDSAWDDNLSQYGQSPQQAANAIIDTSPLTGKYPRFLERAYQGLQIYINYKDENDLDEPITGEACLTAMTKFHSRTARLFQDTGPLSLDVLYKGWTGAEKLERRNVIAKRAAQAGDGTHNDLQEMFVAQGMRSIMSQMIGGSGQDSESAENSTCVVM